MRRAASGRGTGPAAAEPGRLCGVPAGGPPLQNKLRRPDPGAALLENGTSSSAQAAELSDGRS